jgi:hypothetical protein
MCALVRIAALFVALASYSCSVFEFDVEDTIPDTTVPGTAVANLPLFAYSFFPPLPMDIDINQEAASHNASKLNSATLTQLTLAITPTATPGSSDHGNFNFLDVLKIYIEGAAGTNLQRVLIASKNPVPEGLTTLDLEVDDTVNLLPYLEQGHKILCEIAGFPPTHDTSYDGTIVIHVKPF